MNLKTTTTLVLLIGTAGCSTTSDQNALLIEGAQACNTVCSGYPKIDEYSYRAGGGSPLFFLGEFEAHCSCADTEQALSNKASRFERTAD